MPDISDLMDAIEGANDAVTKLREGAVELELPAGSHTLRTVDAVAFSDEYWRDLVRDLEIALEAVAKEADALKEELEAMEAEGDDA